MLQTKILNPEMVRAEVGRFWSAFLGKHGEELSGFYASESSVFGSLSHRPEPGRLAAARRIREYFGRLCVLRSHTGPIEVIMLGDSAAVASYIFEFHAEMNATVAGKPEHILQGRCTQVFALDTDGQLKIFHEHMSLPAE
jgi:ketosteroid isomerase-like protein